MATQIDVLNEVAKKLGQLRKDLCCKFDALILATGGSPTLYNVANSQVIESGNTYSSPAAHFIGFTVIGDPGTETADITVNGNTVTYPVGYSRNLEATTEFVYGMIVVESSSSADVIIDTITSA